MNCRATKGELCDVFSMYSGSVIYSDVAEWATSRSPLRVGLVDANLIMIRNRETVLVVIQDSSSPVPYPIMSSRAQSRDLGRTAFALKSTSKLCLL